MSDGLITKIVNESAVDKQVEKLNAQLDGVIAKIEQVAAIAAKTGVSFKDAGKIKDVSDAQDKLNTATKEAQKLAQQEERLVQQINGLQTEQAKRLQALNEQKRILAEKNRLEAQTNAELVGAYKALVASHELEKKQLKDLAASGDTTSASYKRLAKSVEDNDKKIKKIDASVGEYRRNVGNYVSALQGFGGAAGKLGGIIDGVTQKLSLSPVFLAITAAIGLISQMIASLKSLDSASDAITETWESMKNVLSVLTTRLGEFTIGIAKFISGDFKNGIDQVKSAFTGLGDAMSRAAFAGEQYARIMDIVDDRNTQFITQEAKLRKEAADQIAIYQDQTRATSERRAALERSMEAEGKIAEFRKKQAESVYNAELVKAQGITGLSSKILNWVVQNDEATVKSKMKTDSRIQKAWNVLYGKDGEIIKTLQNANAAILNADSELLEGRRRAIGKLSGFEREIADKAVQAANERTQAQQAADKLRIESGRLTLDEMWQIEKAAIEREKGYALLSEDEKNALLLKRRQDFWDKQTAEFAKQLQDAQDALKKITGGTGAITIPMVIDLIIKGDAPAKMEKIKQGTLKQLDDEQDARRKAEEDKEKETWARRLEMASRYVSAVSNLINSIYANEYRKLDEQASRDEANKEKELRLAGDNQKKKDEIDEKYRRREEKREKDRKKAIHDQAVYEKAVGAVQIVINTAINAMKQVDLASAIAYIALGAIELAALLAQNVPSYRKGRKGGKAEFAKVHEGEQVVYPTGETYRVKKQEEVAYLPAGSDVLTKSEVQGIEKQINIRSEVNRIDKAGHVKMPVGLSIQRIGSDGRQVVTVHVQDKYGKLMLAEMKKKRPQQTVIQYGNMTIIREGNYTQTLIN